VTTAPPIVQGWCPGALRPMESGDGWVVRVRPRAGRLTAVQARGVARLAQTHGNGQIDLSARANLQLRGVTMASHAPLIEGLSALHLLDDSAEAEAQRNVILAPFWVPGDGAVDLALALSQALVAGDAPRLPGKFGFAVDLGPKPVLRASAADIRIESAGAGVWVYAQGARKAALVPRDQAVQAALDLAAWFVAAGGIGADGRGRMQRLLAAGAALPAAFARHVLPAAPPYNPQPGLYPQGALVGAEFGQVQADTLAKLADHGALRLTPWRMLLIEGARAMPPLPGLITAPHDPLLRVIACTGAPGCPQAHGPTRPLARALATHLPPGQVLHLSGCAKGCAHPSAADLTLTATPRGFDLVRAGRAGDMPLARDLVPDQIPQALTHAP
jgi:precorrin-3B synthase